MKLLCAIGWHARKVTGGGYARMLHPGGALRLRFAGPGPIAGRPGDFAI